MEMMMKYHLKKIDELKEQQMKHVPEAIAKHEMTITVFVQLVTIARKHKKEAETALKVLEEFKAKMIEAAKTEEKLKKCEQQLLQTQQRVQESETQAADANARVQVVEQERDEAFRQMKELQLIDPEPNHNLNVAQDEVLHKQVSMDQADDLLDCQPLTLRQRGSDVNQESSNQPRDEVQPQDDDMVDCNEIQEEGEERRDIVEHDHGYLENDDLPVFQSDDNMVPVHAISTSQPDMAKAMYGRVYACEQLPVGERECHCGYIKTSSSKEISKLESD